MDINEITAGNYELVALRWDRPTSKPGQPFTFVRHRRGDVIELDEAEARRLVRAGAVVEPGSRERAEAAAAERRYRAALAQLPDVLRQAAYADVVQEDVEDGGGGTGNDDGGGGDGDDGPPVVPDRPARVAAKGLWVDYVVSRGTPREEAEKLSKDELTALHPD